MKNSSTVTSRGQILAQDLNYQQREDVNIHIMGLIKDQSSRLNQRKSIEAKSKNQRRPVRPMSSVVQKKRGNSGLANSKFRMNSNLESKKVSKADVLGSALTVATRSSWHRKGFIKTRQSEVGQFQPIFSMRNNHINLQTASNPAQSFTQIGSQVNPIRSPNDDYFHQADRLNFKNISGEHGQIKLGSTLPRSSQNKYQISRRPGSVSSVQTTNRAKSSSSNVRISLNNPCDSQAQLYTNQPRSRIDSQKSSKMLYLRGQSRGLNMPSSGLDKSRPKSAVNATKMKQFVCNSSVQRSINYLPLPQNTRQSIQGNKIVDMGVQFANINDNQMNYRTQGMIEGTTGNPMTESGPVTATASQKQNFDGYQSYDISKANINNPPVNEIGHPSSVERAKHETLSIKIPDHTPPVQGQFDGPSPKSSKLAEEVPATHILSIKSKLIEPNQTPQNNQNFDDEVTRQIYQSPQGLDQAGDEMQNLPDDVVQHLYNDPIEDFTPNKDRNVTQIGKMLHGSSYEMNSAMDSSPALNPDDREGLIQKYKKQAAQDSFRLKMNINDIIPDSEAQLHLAPINESAMSKQPNIGKRHRKRRARSSQIKSFKPNQLSHTYAETKQMEIYKQKLTYCARSFTILNKRLKNAMDHKSVEDLLRQDIALNEKKLTNIFNKGTFAQGGSLEDTHERRLSTDFGQIVYSPTNLQNFSQTPMNLVDYNQQFVQQPGNVGISNLSDGTIHGNKMGVEIRARRNISKAQMPGSLYSDTHQNKIQSTLEEDQVLRNDQEQAAQQDIQIGFANSSIASPKSMSPKIGDASLNQDLRHEGVKNTLQTKSFVKKNSHQVQGNTLGSEVHQNIEEMQAIQQRLEEYESYGKALIQQSMTDEQKKIMARAKMQAVFYNQKMGKSINSQILQEIDLENAPDHLLPGEATRDAAIILRDDSEAGHDYVDVSQFEGKRLSIQTVHRKPDQNTGSNHSSRSSELGKRPNDIRGFQEESDALNVITNIPKDNLDPKAGLSQISPSESSPMPAALLNEDLSNNDGTQRAIKDQTNSRQKQGKKGSWTFHSRAAPPKTYDTEAYKRQEMRNRSRILMLSKRQLSASNRKYVSSMSSKVHLIHQRKSSSKDILLDRPLMSQNLLTKRRQEIENAISPNASRPRDSVDYTLGLPLPKFRGRNSELGSPSRSNSQLINNTNQNIHNLSIKSTLVVGSDQNSPNLRVNKESDQDSPKNPMAILNGKMDAFTTFNQNNDLEIMQLQTAGMQSVAAIVEQLSQEKQLKELKKQRVQLEYLSQQLNSLPMQSEQVIMPTQHINFQQPSNDYTMPSPGTVPAQGKSDSRLQEWQNQFGVLQSQELKQPDGNVQNQKVLIQEPPGANRDSANTTSHNINEIMSQQNTSSVSIVSLDQNKKVVPAKTKRLLQMSQKDKALLLEMKRQLYNDDREILDFVANASSIGHYKYDPVAMNKKLLEKQKKSVIKNLENNPMVKEVVFQRMQTSHHPEDNKKKQASELQNELRRMLDQKHLNQDLIMNNIQSEDIFSMGSPQYHLLQNSVSNSSRVNIFNNKFVSELPMTKEEITVDADSDATLKPVASSIETGHIKVNNSINVKRSLKNQNAENKIEKKVTDTLEMAGGQSIVKKSSESQIDQIDTQNRMTIDQVEKSSINQLKSIRNKSKSLQNQKSQRSGQEYSSKRSNAYSKKDQEIVMNQDVRIVDEQRYPGQNGTHGDIIVLSSSSKRLNMKSVVLSSYHQSKENIGSQSMAGLGDHSDKLKAKSRPQSSTGRSVVMQTNANHKSSYSVSQANIASRAWLQQKIIEAKGIQSNDSIPNINILTQVREKQLYNPARPITGSSDQYQKRKTFSQQAQEMQNKKRQSKILDQDQQRATSKTEMADKLNGRFNEQRRASNLSQNIHDSSISPHLQERYDNNLNSKDPSLSNDNSLIVVGKQDQLKERWLPKKSRPSGQGVDLETEAWYLDTQFMEKDSRKVGPGFWGAHGVSDSLELKQEIQKMNDLENIIKTGLNNDSSKQLPKVNEESISVQKAAQEPKLTEPPVIERNDQTICTQTHISPQSALSPNTAQIKSGKETISPAQNKPE